MVTIISPFTFWLITGFGFLIVAFAAASYGWSRLWVDGSPHDRQWQQFQRRDYERKRAALTSILRKVAGKR